MSIHNKPQMIEAVLFFNEHGGICKEMLFPEFEALLDGVVNLPEYSDKQMRIAYVLINPRLLVRAAVFFLLDFHDNGSADSGWNLPLRQLAERAGRGPDLGAGPIRLACRSQCPVSWHQMHLWDPSLAAGNNDLAAVRDAVKRNHMGLLVEDEPAQSVATERLQMVSEDKWYPQDASKEVAETLAHKLDQDHRLQTAQLIQQQRLRLASLAEQHAEELAKARQAGEDKLKGLQAEIHGLHRALHQQEELNAELSQQLATHAASFQQVREEQAQKLQALEGRARTQADILHARMEAEVQARLARGLEEQQVLVSDYKTQLADCEAELALRNEQVLRLQQSLDQLTVEHERLLAEEPILERLSKLGVVFVVYHPGAGHLTIPLSEIARYQENPLGYAAAKCLVTEEHYRQWLLHYQQPTCEALLSSGNACSFPLERVETPSRFVFGESNCCSRHHASSRLRSLS
jgi:hypothetical protein